LWIKSYGNQTKHIKNIYKESELEENQTCSILEQVQMEGKKIGTQSDWLVYNLRGLAEGENWSYRGEN
jgi:hypothetical protein